MELAGHLKMTVAELGLRMSAKEFFRWKQAWQVRPQGETAADIRAARICAAIWRSKGARGVKLSDFAPFVFNPQQVSRTKPTLQQLKDKCRSLAAAFTGVRHVK